MYLQLPDSYKWFYVKNVFEEYVQEFFWIYYSIIYNRYNMSTRDLPDIYAQAEGHCPEGHCPEGTTYIRQISSTHVITNIATPLRAL